MSYDPEDDDIPQPCYLPDDDAPPEVEWHLPAYWWTWPYQTEDSATWYSIRSASTGPGAGRNPR